MRVWLQTTFDPPYGSRVDNARPRLECGVVLAQGPGPREGRLRYGLAFRPRSRRILAGMKEKERQVLAKPGDVSRAVTQ
jgi:hypothetical protein